MLESRDAYTLDDTPKNGLRSLAPKLARGVVATVFSGLCLVATLHILEFASAWPLVLLALAAMAALLSVQLFFLSSRARRLGRGGVFAMSGLQAALGFLPFLAFGQAWVGMPGFVAGSALLMLPAPFSIVAFLVVVGATAVIQTAIEPQVLLVAYTTVSTVLTGLIVYGLSRMTLLVAELHETRAEMAQMAVFNERLRFARDLHDLLGYSLSAVTLKSELTRRLIGRNEQRALAELEEIRDISRQALADVRQLASGYRDMSFDDEARSARSVLSAADIRVVMNIAHPELPCQVSTVLATVLREGVTNLLRHSKAKNCQVAVAVRGDRVRMTIRNDGAEQNRSEPSSYVGSGLRNLTTRTAALGGSLSASIAPDRWFELSAELPLTVAEAVGSGHNAEVVPLHRPKASRPHARSE
ncbi:histidine kinase [Dactylosporangium sp. NPDC051484]|uniref:histidine kinase n=1 Tax=Dactylosporangium sp. NPDC051484 TaxID=3154942 RepID=UPI003450829A